MNFFVRYIHVAAGLMLLCGCSVDSARNTEDAKGHHHHGNENPTEVELTEAQMKTVDIRLGQIGRREMGSVVRANGELAVNPQDMAEVSPLTSGVVRRITVVEGQAVRAGQPVAYIENAEAITIQQDYATALDEAELAGKELSRQQALAAQGAGVRKNLEQARTAAQTVQTRVAALRARLQQLGISAERGKIVSQTAVVSPISGTVTKINVSTGSYADMSVPMMTVVNNRGVFCRLSVFEKELAFVKTGQHVDVRLTNQDSVELSGTVSEITRAFDAATKAVAVRVRLNGDAADVPLIPGMAVTAMIHYAGHETDAVPEGAVASIEGKSYLFVLEDEHKEADGGTAYHFRRVEVATGVKQDGYVEVKPLTAISADDKIVVENVFYLASMTADHGEHNH